MRTRSLSWMAVLGLLTSLCLTSSSADAVLAGVKGLGRASTVVAYPEDTLVAAFNPAGEAWVGDRWDIGTNFDYVKQSAHVHGNHLLIPKITSGGIVLVPVPGVNGHFRADKTPVAYDPEFGINKVFGPCCQWSIGLCIYNRDYLKTTYTKKSPLLGVTHLGLEFINEQVSPFITYRFNDCHSVGLSVNVNVTRLKVNGLQFINDPSAFDPPFTDGSPPRSIHPGHVTNKSYSWSTGVGVTVGYLGKWTDWLSVGVAYTPEVNMPRYKKYKGFLNHRGKKNLPERVNAGIAVHVLNNSTIAVDYEYDNWNRIKSLHHKINLPNPFDPLLGSNHGTGFGWKSQHFVRVGADYRFQNSCWCWLDKLTVRAGYRWASKLFKGNQNVVNQLSCETAREVVTVGFTYELNCNNEVSFWYGHVFDKKLKGHNVIPTNANPLLNFGGGDVDLRQSRNLWGLAYGHNF